MAGQPSTLHQYYQPMPKLDAPLTNPNGNVSIPWYYFLVSLWQRVGGSNIPTNSKILFDSSAGAAEQVQAPVANPFTFKAPVVGSLTVAGGKVELQRSGAWYEVSVLGGSFWLMSGDSARISWFGDAPPEVVWWPTQ